MELKLTTSTSPIDSRTFRNTLGRFASGVTVITALVNEQVYGMTANAFISVSLNPPLVLVSVDKKAHMHEVLLNTDRYGVSFLAEHHAPVSDHFAGRATDNVAYSFTEKQGMKLINDAIALLVTRIVDTHPAGDHTLFIGQVEFMETNEGRPLLYYAGQYDRLAE
jgi:flavin reductase (DIM6/NTAB) family NADH-FMN oxidoreductase RutF